MARERQATAAPTPEELVDFLAATKPAAQTVKAASVFVPTSAPQVASVSEYIHHGSLGPAYYLSLCVTSSSVHH